MGSKKRIGSKLTLDVENGWMEGRKEQIAFLLVLPLPRF
jgi:hypothetical protein